MLFIHFLLQWRLQKKAKVGVDIFIHERFQRNIKNWEESNERVMTMELEIWGLFLMAYTI